ncbi:MAG: hypothetical protein PHY42_06645 [Bacilli bacterium]|nr:hypothetical protein [Bacilli bacterium]
MKNLKKLFVAAIMLVVALTAVVSSTYAWFTMQNQVDVDEMTLNVGTAGLDLQISGTGTTGDFGYSLSLGTPEGILTPVTFDNSDNGFKYLALDTTKSFFEYATATSFGMSGTTGAYLAYDLWFVTSSEGGVSLYLDTTANPFTDVDGLSTYAMRIMFVPVVEGSPVWTSKVIYEPITGTGTYGTGPYFLDSNNYIAYNSFKKGTPSLLDDFLKPVNEGVYELNDDAEGDYMYGRQYTTNTPIDNKLTIGSLSQNTIARFRVFIWIEGWDGDANDTMAEKDVKTYLLFKGE